MRILVTGATGRIGSRLAPRLLQQGDTIRVLARKAEQVENVRQRGAEVAVGDLLQPDTLLRAVADADVVVHLAAFFRGATEAQARAVNTEGTLALARVAQQAGVSRFIYISTNLVYGHGYGRPAREDDEPHPQPGNIYPVTKLSAERALQDLDRVQKFGLCILRLAFVYGEGDPHLADAVRWAQAWHPEKRFHMVHHADVAQAGLSPNLPVSLHGKRCASALGDTQQKENSHERSNSIQYGNAGWLLRGTKRRNRLASRGRRIQ